MKNNIQKFNDRLDSDKELYLAFKKITVDHPPKSSEWYDCIVDFGKKNGYVFTKLELISHFNDENNPVVKFEVLEYKLKELETLNVTSGHYFNQKIDELNKEIGRLKKINSQLEKSNTDKEKIISDLHSQIQNLSNSLSLKTNEIKKYTDELNALKQTLGSRKNKGSCLVTLIFVLIFATAISSFWANNFLQELSGIKSENERNKDYRYKYENQVQELIRIVKSYEITINNQQWRCCMNG